MSGQGTPTRSQMLSLSAQGWDVSECWMGGYYDGLIARLTVGATKVEVYAGSADDGEYSDLHYPPVVYVNDREVASGLPSVDAAVRVARMRVLLANAALAKFKGGAA